MGAPPAATGSGWYVGGPSYHDEPLEWVMYAFNPTERATAGLSSLEWTAIGRSEHQCVREIARCLRETSAGRVPKWN